MPRQARLDAPGILQHIMARGIERRKIFWDDKDRAAFLKRLGTVLEETQTQCYAWALIPNHFHILLRTGTTPLSKVMRRLMTGYAVTFNKRHKRMGHLFQNRYKSVVCEEDTYLLELIRYIHLNPLRAKLVEDLKALDEYPWTGHSALMGKKDNPLVPDIPPSIDGDKYLAEKTLEDVLKHFGKTIKKAQIEYRLFVENGINLGRREDLQGGGLIRSAGGDKRVLLGRKKGEKEKGDERILGSGDFVSSVLKDAEEYAERKATNRISLPELIARVCKKFEIETRDLMQGKRRGIFSKARAVISYLAVYELSCTGSEIARAIRISEKGVSKCVERGKKLLTVQIVCVNIYLSS